MKNYIIGICIFFFTATLKAQNDDVKFTNSNFPNQQNLLLKAKQQIKEADLLILENNIQKALNLYLKANEFNPNNSDLNFKIGSCYFNYFPKQECLKYFEKAYNLNNKVDRKILFYLAIGNHFNYKFKEAIRLYSEYLENANSKETTHINKLIQECENGIEILKDTTAVEIINLGANVNTEYREYAPMVVADGSKVYFTSRRKGTGGQIAMEDNMYYEDIYETTRDEKTNTWSKAKNIGNPLNTKLHDAIVGLSPNGQTMFVYVDNNGGDIYFSQLKGAKWTKPENISTKINSQYHESKACISYDNKVLYFISNNPKTSYGGKDIYYSILDSQGEWSAPVNIGPTINTEYDEVDLFIHPDGRTIYFSSKGHNTMGGLDIFKTYKDENGKWVKPINIGYPINTPLDDAFFVMTSSGKSAFFSSIRPEGYGQHDLYELKFPTKEKEKIKPQEKVLVTLVKGKVKDANSKIPLEAKIEITNNTTGEIIANFITNSQTGDYMLNLPSGINYGLNVSKEQYLFHSENFNIADTTDFREVVIDVDLQKIEIGKTIILKNIFFDFDKATLRPESTTELNRVVNILNKETKLKIEIAGHTDSKGSSEYNKQLSSARAKTVVEYLIEAGINKNRLSFEGYGYQKPIATNETEEGRQMNRRVEFKILSKD